MNSGSRWNARQHRLAAEWTARLRASGKWKVLTLIPNRAGNRVAIPIAGDDQEALRVAARLVTDAGFEPVVVGSLARARLFDVGTSVYTQLLTADELKARLGL
jgi:8-hydroxy-5-deazaflavin:NADPH oxidoreductase